MGGGGVCVCPLAPAMHNSSAPSKDCRQMRSLVDEMKNSGIKYIEPQTEAMNKGADNFTRQAE
jgi:hypothetical protein